MKKLLIPVIILLIAIVAIRSWYLHALGPVDQSQVQTIFTVDRGESTAAIAADLASQKLIRSAFAFKVYVKLSGKAGLLKAGTFSVTSSMSAPQIVDALAGGKTTQEIITIPEGLTVEDIDDLLAKKGIAKAGDLTNCAQICDVSAFTFLPKNTDTLAPRGGKVEGYLFPDTYYVSVGDFTAESFMGRLLTTFKHRVVEDLAPDIKASKHSLNDIVTVASLVEEESRSDAERAIVAGIIWKRLDQHMVLGIDAAVRYVADRKGGALTESDLQMDSPYNLRKVAGLPPGPIASPSLSSIKAALHPETSPYFYYLHDKNGVIHYAVTNEEHNANRAKYLR